MEKFKVGDRVKVISTDSTDPVAFGTKGKVIDPGIATTGVQFTKKSILKWHTAHDCTGSGKHGQCWYFINDQLEKA
jgi:hypothetical protein